MFSQVRTFIKALQICFRVTSYDDPMEGLINIKQTSTVKIYKTQEFFQIGLENCLILIDSTIF